MIYIDSSRYNNTIKKTGVENYSVFLIDELCKKHSNEITLISPKKINIDVNQLVIPFPKLWTQIRLSFEIFKNKKINNIFIPSHLLPIIHPKNSTITIHDTAWKHTPESYGFLSKLYLNWGAKFAVKHAKKIIVPSNTTKDDLISFFKADDKKIHVIPLGFSSPKINFDSKNEEGVLNKFKINKGKYFLYIGRIEYKKNTNLLIKAFKEFKKNNNDIKLVIAGSIGKGGDEIIKLISEELSEKIVLTGYISDEEKNILYKNSLCFIFPSRYEGFGIPILEAMYFNIPIIASNIPTSYEIAKGYAEFFDLSDEKKLVEQMNKVNKIDYPKKDSTEILNKYSWVKCAEETYIVLSN